MLTKINQAKSKKLYFLPFVNYMDLLLAAKTNPTLPNDFQMGVTLNIKKHWLSFKLIWQALSMKKSNGLLYSMRRKRLNLQQKIMDPQLLQKL